MDIRLDALWANERDPEYDAYDHAPPEAVERFRNRTVDSRTHR
jgi:hypothetical protein